MASVEVAAAAVANTAPIVKVTGLRKRFGSNEVLKGIDLDVKAGEVIAIIGKSGSGKSTLLRCINGLETFEDGKLSVDNQPLLHGNAAAMRALRQRVGLIFQSFNLFPHLSVGHNVMLAPTLAEEGMTLPMVTHEMSFARKVSDRLVFMHAGRIHEMGSPEQLFGNPKTAELKQFLSALQD